MEQFLSNFSNLDLLSVGIASAGMSVLGFAVIFSNTRSISNIFFFFLTLSASLWGIMNYSFFQPHADSQTSLWLLRFTMLSAISASFFTYALALVFPSESKKLSPTFLYILLPLTLLMGIMTLTPFVFERVGEIDTQGRISEVTNGVGIFAFALLAGYLNIGATVILFRKFKQGEVRYKKQLRSVLLGMSSMIALIIVFNFIFPAFLKITRFVPLGALFLLPFVASVAHASLRHGFFNLKITGVALLVFALSATTLTEIIFATDVKLIIYRVSVFLFVLLFGINLIRGVIREVEQREEIQKLADELQAANDRQAGLMHFITHQVKGFFTMSRNIFSLMLENTFGELPPDMRRMAQQGFENTTKGVVTVQEILNASNLQKGTVQMTMQQFDLLPLIQEVLGGLNSRITERGLQLATVFSSGPVFVMGDRFQLQEVYRNLIDNAIRYTPKGTVVVKLEKKDAIAHFEVKDSGVGISEEDKKRLFTEGGRGSESLKVNVESTGFGLFIVKGIVEQHKGKVWADSEGQGKGSTFCVDLPLIP